MNFRSPLPKNPLTRKRGFKYKESYLTGLSWIPTYNRTYWLIPVSTPIPNWTWSYRRLLLCTNLHICDWLHNNLLDCCSFCRVLQSTLGWTRVSLVQNPRCTNHRNNFYYASLCNCDDSCKIYLLYALEP